MSPNGRCGRYLGRAGVEQGGSRSRSELVLLRLHRDSGARRLVGGALRRQARVRQRHSRDARRHVGGPASGPHSRRSHHRAPRHHGPRLRTCVFIATQY